MGKRAITAWRSALDFAERKSENHPMNRVSQTGKVDPFQGLLGVGLIVLGLFLLAKLLISMERQSGEVVRFEATFERLAKVDRPPPFFDRHRHRAKNYQFLLHGHDEQNAKFALWFPGEVLGTHSPPLLEGQKIRVSCNEERDVLLKLERNGLTLIDEVSVREASGSRNFVAGFVALALLAGGLSIFFPLIRRRWSSRDR